MISFSKWLYEYAAGELSIDSPKSTRRGSKIAVDSSKFNIIPLRMGYDTYIVFKKYSETMPKFAECDRLLDRRGDSVNWEKVFSSNEELANLKELSDYIIKNSNDENHIRVAHATLDRIRKTEDELATS